MWRVSVIGDPEEYQDFQQQEDAEAQAKDVLEVRGLRCLVTELDSLHLELTELVDQQQFTMNALEREVNSQEDFIKHLQEANS